jgi:hypothetical protein
MRRKHDREGKAARDFAVQQAHLSSDGDQRRKNKKRID